MTHLSARGISHLILPIVIVITIGFIGTLVYVVSSAQTPATTPVKSSSTAAPETSGFKICTHTDSGAHLCLQAHGTGNDGTGGLVSISSSSDSYWTTSNGGAAGSYVKNSHGNCLFERSDGLFMGKRCADNKFYKWQLRSASNGGYDFINAEDKLDMCVAPLENNVYVTLHKPATDYYCGWSY